MPVIEAPAPVLCDVCGHLHDADEFCHPDFPARPIGRPCGDFRCCIG